MKTITINIPFTFTENYTPSENIKILSTKKIVGAWSDVIAEAINARINHCKLALFDNRERVYKVASDHITYYTSEGVEQHYNFSAIEAMEKVLRCIEQKYFDPIVEEEPLALQVLKALYEVSTEVKASIKEGTTFEDLYSLLLNSYEIIITNKGEANLGF